MDIESTTSSKKKFSIFTILIVVLAFAVLIITQKRTPVLQPVAQTERAVQEPQKTDFGTSMPTDFATDIPVEEGVKVEQSYGLNYAGQKQLTIVFQSTKTVKENYALYADFLKKQNWMVINKYENPKLYSLVGEKGNNGINVTISEDISSTSTKSRVNISILKK